tara:strand:+ start:8670 stop:9710 length:1041 start_codon:yes stop_codon:yes gene_type:complete
MVHMIDKENMYNAIWNFPDNLSDALSLSNNIKPRTNYAEINNILIVGMGGSAIGADILSTLEKDNMNIPFFISRDYTVPNWVNKHTLVICSSYSGNTEETLSSLDDALNKGAQVCGITTGGLLEDNLKSLDKDVIHIPKGMQPRAALAYSVIIIILFLKKIKLLNTKIDNWLNDSIKSIKKNRDLYKIDSNKNPTFKLAEKIYNKIPIIYSNSTSYGVAAFRLKGQLNENSKMLCYCSELPEMNHNEIVGWENNHIFFKHLFVIWLNDQSDNDRVKYRQKITQSIIAEKGVEQTIIQMDEKCFQSRLLNMIHYLDWLSYWCAIKHNTNPTPVKNIDKLKAELKKRQ